MNTRKLRGCLVLVGALALASLLGGCGGPEYRAHQVDQVVKPSGGEASVLRVRVPHGAVVKAHILAFNTDSKRMEGDVVSGDPTVVEVNRVITGPDDYAFLGLRTGKTVLRLVADGQVAREVECEVFEAQDL